MGISNKSLKHMDSTKRKKVMCINRKAKYDDAQRNGSNSFSATHEAYTGKEIKKGGDER